MTTYPNLPIGIFKISDGVFIELVVDVLIGCLVIIVSFLNKIVTI
ncbi:hypothetical protein [Candidatus Tisiphia endosymbiont of Xenochironomus xenolabis]